MPGLSRTVAQRHDADDTGPRPVLVWTSSVPVRALSTAVLGGGLGERTWIVNAEVGLDYRHADPEAHARAIAAGLGLVDDGGIGLLTAARVLEVASGDDAGATCDATVGVSIPTWAAAPDGDGAPWTPGTINLVCWVPALMTDAALANLLLTVTEAKTQALLDAGVPGTGTATDAVVVCCPPGGTERYGGPRSVWGARLARAAHRAVGLGVERFVAARA